MATHLRDKSFQRNLFISVGGIFILFAICFSAYQYNREKEYKIDIMQSRLQMYNYEMVQTLGDSIISTTLFSKYVLTHNVEGLRVTLIGLNGNVLLDSKQNDVSKMKNHLHRQEVQQALSSGSGYDLKRASQSIKETYFYSATLIHGKKDLYSNKKDKTQSHPGITERGFIIRTAVPYNAQLTQSLKADNTYLYFALALTVMLGLVLYYNTSRIGRHIGYLREFAVEADEGKDLDHQLERQLPDDELGDISHTIITLYWRLRHSEEDKLRIKRQLTQNAAHELKTPAASIHGYLESIIENPDMPKEKRQHFLERCYAQSERMSKLLLDMAQLTKLDDMEDASKYKSTSRKEEDKLIDVKPIILSVLDDTALQLQEKGIKPILELPEHIIVSGDQSLIYSIFRNLVDNAIAYATDTPWIKIIYREGQFLFSDNGPGVEINHLPHLFERFYRVDKGRSRKLGGTGLGLAIVKNAVAAHGGTTTAEITPGGGLTIKFNLK